MKINPKNFSDPKPIQPAKLIILTGILTISLIFTTCQTGSRQSGGDPLASHMDTTIVPGDDFFQYANGNWFKQHPIPASEGSNGIFLMIEDTINAQIRNICQSAASTPGQPQGTLKQKIGDFYYSGMDSTSINKKGLADLQTDFSQIDQIKDLDGLIREATYIHSVSNDPLFSFYVSQDDRISNKEALFISQGGLSLPDRNYYFDQDDRAKETRAKFLKHLEHVYIMLGYPKQKAEESARHQMKLETSLASISRKSEDTRDPLKNYSKIAFTRLVSMAPNISWSTFAALAGLPSVDTVIVRQPEFLSGLSRYLKSIPLADWKDYLKYQLLNGLAESMDDSTYLEFFNFYDKTLYGVSEPQPRWKRVVEKTDGLLGDLIGQVYVSEYLPKGTKEKLLEIGHAVKDAYAERIKHLDWMTEPTKEKALAKLNAIIMKVGYPDKWKDMHLLEIDRKSYLKNTMQARIWWFRYNASKYGKPVDRTEWDMEPQTYNAYYNPSNNEICVPGCNIIIPGYERHMADDALLYAIIGGSTFGHEMTHGFDDQGCKYDAQGNLHNWWTRDDSIRFYRKATQIVRQFNSYVAVDSLHINGSLTQGENIADLGGIMIGYDAFTKTKQFRENQKIAGFTPKQRFFLGYALAWMVNQRPEQLATQVRTNEHSPARFRVIGPLSNMPEFYETFGVKPGNAMWRPDSLRVKIW